MLYNSSSRPKPEEGGDAGERRRQKLVVRSRDGKVAFGFTLSLNKSAEGFHMELVDKHNQSLGKSVYVQFKDIKAVFYVKSFDGRFDPDKYDHSKPDNGVPLVLIFEDGEIAKGYSLGPGYAREPRFFFTPEESDSNNLGMLVERAAVAQILSPEEYKKLQHDEVETYVSQHAKPGTSREELLGDFQFGKHEYLQALRHYREVREKEDSAHIRKKLCTAKYNVAVCHIRQRDYQRALRYMELVLELDPTHEQALRKVDQLREHLAKRHR
jgi:tetratricopeptide (TPR) repeat protein